MHEIDETTALIRANRLAAKDGERHLQSFFVGGNQGGGGRRGLPQAGHTQRNQANPTAGGPRQSLTREIRPTPLSQELPSARTKIAWELEPAHLQTYN
jgi:hypothetical protein